MMNFPNFACASVWWWWWWWWWCVCMCVSLRKKLKLYIKVHFLQCLCLCVCVFGKEWSNYLECGCGQFKKRQFSDRLFS